MAKKLNNVYINQTSGHKILIDTDEKIEIRQPEKSTNGFAPVKKDYMVWRIFRPVVITIISLAIVCVGVYYSYNYFQEKYFSPVDVNDTSVIEVNIPPASSLSTIAQILYDHQVIRNKNVFKLYTDFSDMSYKLKAGTYELSKSMTFDDIIFSLMKGESSSPVTDITLTEGMTIEAMAASLVDKGVYKNAATFLDLSKDGTDFSEYPFIEDVIKLNDNRDYVLEGYLFPDTYQIYTNSTEDVVIKKQLDRFDQIYNSDYVAKTEEMGWTIDQVVTLASIIEREGKPKDFKKISAVFHNRLDQKMPLQSCATLQYATGLKKYVFNDKELATESPYNTYLNPGLPVGPICCPSKNAIEAVLFPDEQFVQEGYLFFCLTTPESGELVFAKTYEEHLANVDQYQESWLAAQGE